MLIIIAVMLLCFPLFAQESNTEDAGATAGANAATGCERLHLGSWESMETEEGEGEVVKGDAVTDEEYLSDMELYDQSQQEGKQEELLCEEKPNPDGTLTCYENDKPLTCQIQGKKIFCPE